MNKVFGASKSTVNDSVIDLGFSELMKEQVVHQAQLDDLRAEIRSLKKVIKNLSSEDKIEELKTFVPYAVATEVSKLNQLRDKSIIRGIRELEEKVERLNATIESSTDENGQLILDEDRQAMSPYDDFDLQVKDLKEFVTSRTKRWHLYENFFYGLVVVLLLTNLGLLLFFKAS